MAPVSYSFYIQLRGRRGVRPELHPVASPSEAPRREMPLSAHTNCGGRPVTQALVSWKSLCPYSGFDDAGINAAIHAWGQQAGGWRWSRLRQS